MSNAQDNIAAQVDRLEAASTANTAELVAIKAKLDAAIASNDTSGLQALSDRIGAVADGIVAADAAAAG